MILLISLGFGLAQANTNVTICAEYRLDYIDNGQEDYLKGAVHPAWGAQIDVINIDTGMREYREFSPYDGPDEGCITVSLSTNANYTARLRAKAQVRGHTLKVLNDDRRNQLWRSSSATPFRPVDTNNVTIQSGLHRAWRVAATMGWAHRRRGSTFDATTFTAYTCGCQDGEGDDCLDPEHDGWQDYPRDSCMRAGDIYIGADDDAQKFVIAHEVGHAYMYELGGEPNIDSGFVGANVCEPEGNAAGHYIQSEEYEGLAAVEGFGWYYAAVAFNNTTQDDCILNLMEAYPDDWDFDGDDDLIDDNAFWLNEGEYPCVYGSGGPNYAVSHTSILETVCEPSEAFATGVEFDWFRFFWALDSVPLNFRELGWTETTNVIGLSHPPWWWVVPYEIPFGDYPSQMMYEYLPADLWPNFTWYATIYGTDRGMNM